MKSKIDDNIKRFIDDCRDKTQFWEGAIINIRDYSLEKVFAKEVLDDVVSLLNPFLPDDEDGEQKLTFEYYDDKKLSIFVGSGHLISCQKVCRKSNINCTFC